MKQLTKHQKSLFRTFDFQVLSIMDIQAEKIALAKMLLETNNIEIIDAVKNIFSRAKSADFWDELSQEEQDEIKLGLEQLNAGQRIPLEDFIKKVS